LILRHQLAVQQRRQSRRPHLTWADRALLAALLSVIPKARRQGLRLLVTPDTILRWHRDILRRRWAVRSMRRRTGRPATRRNIKALVLRLARENHEWSYRRIHGELAGLGVEVAASTVWEILKTNGIGPAPRRTGPTWSQSLRSQAEAILACDFFTVDMLNGTQAHVLTVIGHATRRIRILGVTLFPTGDWTAQKARNLIMDLGEQAERMKFMIRDRGSNFTAVFEPPRTPGPHPHLEPEPSAGDPARVRNPPQSAPASPGAGRSGTAETTALACRSWAVPRPKTGLYRWSVQRVSPGRVMWMRFSAPTGFVELLCGTAVLVDHAAEYLVALDWRTGGTI
jgi:transposase